MAETSWVGSLHRAIAMTTLWLTIAVGVLGVLSVLVTTPAGAQEDPYGSTSTTTTTASDSAVSPSCRATLTTGEPGAMGELHVTDVPSAGTVRVLIGGVEAGRATDASGTTLDIPFTIPDLPPDQYTVVAVGVDFTLTCDPGALEVLGAAVVRSGILGRGPLPRTGISLALLLVAAVVLLLVGLRLLSASRRRRRAARERARSSSHHRAHLHA